MNPTDLEVLLYLWHMVITNRNLFPKIWVGTSMLTLTFFLGYWNYTNYQSEKRQLQEYVNTQLQLAYTEIMDSVFIEEIIIMTKINSLDVDLIKNTMSLGDHIAHAVNDSFHSKLKIVDLKKNPDFRDSFKIITYSDNLKDQANHKLKSDSSAYTYFQSDSSQFKKGDILKADQISMMIESMFTAKVDHKPKIISLFKNKLDRLNYPSSFQNDSLTVNEGLSVYYKGDREYDIPIELKILDYTTYLLKSLIPSIIFSILLLGIVSLAFWSLLSIWAKQKKLIEIKNEFISNMTHELKTPISTVSVALEAMSGFDLSKEETKTKEYVDISRHELSRLALIVDKVLKMASYEGTNEEMKSQSIDLGATIESIVTSMKLNFEEKGAAVTFNNISNNSTMMGDDIHITNVIYNVIDNALKYSDNDPLIDIEISEHLSNLILKISDNGKGIPKEYQSKIFDRFFRVPTSDRHNVKGHGLGLSYVKDIVIKHRGKIHVESKEGKGTKIIITLPKINTNV